jgi:hypothetical protein
MAGSPQLLDLRPDERRTGSKALVPLDPTVCANCGTLMVADVCHQPALFYFGGYGETQRGTSLWCPACGWTGGHRRESENPRSRVHRSETLRG